MRFGECVPPVMHPEALVDVVHSLKSQSCKEQYIQSGIDFNHRYLSMGIHIRSPSSAPADLVMN
jgi:hypothetical protein